MLAFAVAPIVVPIIHHGRCAPWTGSALDWTLASILGVVVVGTLAVLAWAIREDVKAGLWRTRR